jgi:cephalosporin hydroxylase
MRRDLIDQINAAGSDNREYFGATWTGGYHIQQDPQEFAELVELLQGIGLIYDYLSIGIAAGGVERFLCENADIGVLTVIDDGQHPNHKHWEENRAAIRKDHLVMETYCDSHSKEAAEFLQIVRGKYNLVGIDGDHSTQGVLQDWELVQPYLAPNALVWFHDTVISEAGQTGARKLVARLKTQHEVILETNGKFGIGVIRVP